MAVVNTTDHGGIPAFADRRKLVYTHTIFAAYKNCPYAMYRTYIVRDIPYIETPERKVGNDVAKALELRIGASKPLPLDLHHLESYATPFDGREAKCEQKLACTSAGVVTDYWSPTAWFRGQPDVSMISGNKAYVCDFKTGSSKYETPFQLETYAVLLKFNYRNLTTIVGNYVWLKENRLGKKYDLSEFRKTWDEMQRLARLIENDLAAGEFRKQKSGLCGWCGVRDCENFREVGR